jgi:uncharacterized protein (TIGR03435 family)
MTNNHSTHHYLRTGPLLLAMLLAGFATRAPAQEVVVPLMSDLTPKTPAADVKVPDYDVVSVKPNKSDAHMIKMMNTPDGLSMSNVTLKMLIANAYGIRQDLISGGPGWVESDHFDFDAKVAGVDVETYKKLNRDQKRAMLTSALTERFKLKVHTETKVIPVYELTVARGGPKLKETAPVETKPADGPGSGSGGSPAIAVGRKMTSFSIGGGHYQMSGAPMSALANQLSSVERRSVIDRTGLTGNYDIDLKWTPDDAPAGGDGDTGPSIFTALQEQLGLKLEAAKGPVETLVVDHAEAPSEN